VVIDLAILDQRYRAFYAFDANAAGPDQLARISHTGWDLRGDRGSYTLRLWR